MNWFTIFKYQSESLVIFDEILSTAVVKWGFNQQTGFCMRKLYNIMCTTFMALVFQQSLADDSGNNVFNQPRVNGVLLDYCQNWGANCGQVAADNWCTQQGFNGAQKFVIAKNVGGRENTWVAGDHKLCEGSYCDGFEQIKCISKPQLASAKSLKKINRNGIQKIKNKDNTGFSMGLMNVVAKIKLLRCDSGTCEQQLPYAGKLNPNASSNTVYFTINANLISSPTSLLWQVSDQPFSEGLSIESIRSAVVIEQGETNGKTHRFTVDFAKLVKQTAYSPKAFYIRAIALDQKNPKTIRGRSDVMTIYYKQDLPQNNNDSFKFHTQVYVAPNIALTQFSYKDTWYVENWPAGCKPIPRDEGTHGIDAVGRAFEETFGFVGGAYQWAKDTVIDIADTVTLGVIPKSVWKIALDAALVAAGIPPDLPDLSSIMDQGVDYFAAEIAKQALAQIPAANVALASNSLLVDMTAEQIKNMSEQALRDKLEEKLKESTKLAIQDAAKAAEQKMIDHAEDTYCRLKSYPRKYMVTLKNNDSTDLKDIKLELSDENRVFEKLSLSLDLKQGEEISIPLLPSPNIRKVNRSQLESHNDSMNQSHWHDEYYRKPTKVILQATGVTECMGENCQTKLQPLYKSTQLVLSEDHQWVK